MQKNSCEIVLVPLPIGENSWEQMDTEYYRNEIVSIKCWVAENARTLRRFLSGLKLDINISELDILELDRDIKQQEIEAFLKENLDKPKIGVCSEAGMPCIADPGNRIVDWAHHRELRVRPLVGPSSLFLTLAASGLNGQSFTFHGYAPLENFSANLDRVCPSLAKANQPLCALNRAYLQGGALPSHKLAQDRQREEKQR